jgi:hypothetical protein
MRAIFHLTGVLLATSAGAEPSNYDACENIQDSREYAHCIATLGGAGGNKTSAPGTQVAPAPEPQAAPPETEAPAPRTVATKVRGRRVVLRAAPSGGGRVRAQIGARQQKFAHLAAKAPLRRGKGRR